MGNCFLTNRAGNVGGGTTISFNVYSAANDTVYYYVNGSSVTLCTTDSSGKALGVFITVPNLPYNLTLYSTVAKNLTNTTNPYSKTVTLTSLTTDVKVMPDGSMYWFEYYNSNTGDFVNFWNPPSEYQWSKTAGTNSVRLAGTNSQEVVASVTNPINATGYSSFKICFSGTLEGNNRYLSMGVFSAYPWDQSNKIIPSDTHYNSTGTAINYDHEVFSFDITSVNQNCYPAFYWAPANYNPITIHAYVFE